MKQLPIHQAAITHPPIKQQGAALLIALVFLLIMSLAGVASMQLASHEVRMSNSFKDRSFAFQAAEGALAEAEAFVLGKRLNGLNVESSCEEDCFVDDCTGGLCFSASSEYVPNVRCEIDVPNPRLFLRSGQTSTENVAVYQDENKWAKAKAVTVNINGVAADAKVLIEFFCFIPLDEKTDDGDLASNPPPNSAYWKPFFKISSLAQGATSDSRVMLQSTFTYQ